MTLVFDTETTNKADLKKPPEDICQPRLVSLAAILFDEVYEPVAELYCIIKPEPGVISCAEALAAHGITHEKATKYGLSEKPVLSFFAGLCARAKVLVAHNIQFDGLIIGKAMSVHLMNYAPPDIKFCTMHTMTDICRIPNQWKNGFKWPKLQEAYKHCFQKEFPGAHNSMNDVKACARVYQWICNNAQPNKPNQEV